MRNVIVPGPDFGSGLAAVRVIQAVRDAGMHSVAVFSDDIDALYVALADEAVSVDGRESVAGEEFPLPQSTPFSAEAAEPAHHSGRARAISVWVMRDRAGAVCALGTTDGSVQRRGEPIVVESPAPFLSESVLGQLEQAAGTTDLVGVSVVEALVSGDSVTVLGVAAMPVVGCAAIEQVTGLDLYREQLRLADGGSVPGEVSSRGHAIEFAIHAEDAALGFLAEPAVLQGVNVPGGPGVRVDVATHRTGTRPTLIRGDGDSLLATVTARGTDRDQALTVAARALPEFTATGVATLIPFHRRLISEPDFAAPTFGIHARWVEEDCLFDLEPAPAPATHPEELWGEDFADLVRFTAEVDGELVEVAASVATLGMLGIERMDG